jgi:hypothetical protein
MHMRTRQLFAVAAAALGLAAALPANAADLNHGYPAGSAFDDRRYSDIYRHPAPQAPPPRYAEPYYAPPAAPPPYAYREPQHYAPPPPPYRNEGRIAGDCLPRHIIRQRLEGRGWHDFHDPQVAGNVAHIRARRPNGNLFDLTVDRCTGEVLQAQLIDQRSALAPMPPPDWRYRDDRRYRY